MYSLPMKKALLFVVVFFLLGALFVPVHAQMMGQWNWNTQGSGSSTLSIEDQEDIATGQKLYEQLQNKQISCSNVQPADFDKIGEYVMQEQLGNNSQTHAQMNQAMQRMMGQQGEENMHIILGERATNCSTNASSSSNNSSFNREGVLPMMGWNWGSGMMGWGGALGAFGIFAGIFWLVSLIDLILLGIWLWKQIRGNK